MARNKNVQFKKKACNWEETKMLKAHVIYIENKNVASTKTWVSDEFQEIKNW